MMLAPAKLMDNDNDSGEPSAKRSNNGAGNDHMGGNTPYVTQQLLIPGSKCGLIIGKNGETIKSMQETIGVKMLLIQENQAVSAAPKPLRITGHPEKVEQAKRAVELLLANDDGSGANRGPMISQQKSVGEVIVPRSSVGVIIGKGGETIKRLGAESGTKIQFKPEENTNSAERCAVIQGTPEQISRATNMIWDLVQRSSGNQQQEVCLMHVPANKTGLVIGKGGETIKGICNESMAHVELSREPPPNNAEKIFVIKGTPYQIHVAQHLIRIKVGDIPPGTPTPSFPGMPQPSFQQYQGGNDHYQQQQWPVNGYGAGQPQYGGGAQPYQQPQQQIMQPGAVPQHAGQAQATAATGQGPSINPATGQPDYSAQWAEYYRSVGMHEQAALIERQMKSGRP